MSGNQERRFFHSFPRPRNGETGKETLDRALRILTYMRSVGLVLAPEIVTWNVKLLSPEAPPVNLLQRRISFTELGISELPRHSATFGPISLAFDIARLREAGAVPVIYVPQGTAENPASLIPIFCVNGVHHTKFVLSQLQQLQEMSDPHRLEAQFRMPIAPECTIKLQNSDGAGKVVAENIVRISDAQNILKYVGFNNIPFDHSAAILGYFLNLFYPTDNTHINDQLGYYRQREWRFIQCDIGVKGRPIARNLSTEEASELMKIDAKFWEREITVDSKVHRRSDLASIYEPTPNWDFLDLVLEVFAPKSALDSVRAIVSEKATVREMPEE